MFKRRSFARLLVPLLALSMLLAACGGGAKPAEQPPASSPQTGGDPAPTASGPVEVELWFAIGGKGREWIEQAAEDFNKSQDEVIVNAIYQGDYYTNHQKLAAGIAANTVPAMSMIEVASMPFFASNGVLADLNQYASADDLADFLPGLMQEAVWEGQTVAVPFNRSVPILYMNATLLKEAGLDPAGPKTWDELREYAKVLNIPGERWGFLTPIDIWFYEAMVFQAGGSFFNEALTEATFNGPEGQLALQMWVDLIHTDGVMEMPQGEKYNAWDVTTAGLQTGTAAMIYSTTGRLAGHLSNMTENGFEMATAFLPAGPAGFATPTGGANIVVLAGAPKEQQEAAWKFLKWATSPEKAAEFAQATGYLPVTQSAVALMDDFFAEVPQAKVAVDQLQYAQPRPQAPAYAEVQEIIMSALQKAVLGEASVKDALDEAANLANRALKQ